MNYNERQKRLIKEYISQLRKEDSDGADELLLYRAIRGGWENDILNFNEGESELDYGNYDVELNDLN